MNEIDRTQGPSIPSPVIAIPADIDPARRKRLEVKLAEYRQRLMDELTGTRYPSPEMFLDTKYKIAVLAAVLESGSVATHALSQRIGKENGGIFDAPTFNNACAVIADYIATGGQKIVDPSRPFEELPV